MKEFTVHGSRVGETRLRSAAPLAREAGAALLTAIVILLALTIMGFALVLVTKVDLSVSRNLRLAETAMYAAENGAYTTIQQAEDPANLGMAVGEVRTLGSSSVEATNAYPQWHTHMIREGLAPKVATSSIEEGENQVSYFQYRIQSKGLSQPRVLRTVEIMVRVMQIEHSGGSGYRRIAHRY